MNLFRKPLPCLAAFVSFGVLVTLAAHAQVKEVAKIPSPQSIPQVSGNSDDGAIKEAESAQKVVQQKEEQLLKLLQEIAESTKDIEPGNLPKAQKALEGFKKLLPLLKERSAWLLNKQE